MTLPAKARIKLTVRGAVQGVGFRPFVSRLASEMKVVGWVNNTPQGVLIEAEASPSTLDSFMRRLREDRPASSQIRSMQSTWLNPRGCRKFEIRPSSHHGPCIAEIIPDLATCPDCISEMMDPANRRYRYPFINCTHCGPRFSIIKSLPYDRANTSMEKFKMCATCQAEYDNPLDRRYHAQPNACPECGPMLSWMDARGRVLKQGGDALHSAVKALKRGRIVAVKGVGGYHLMADASNNQAVLTIRERKQRRDKPMGLLFPSLSFIKGTCAVSGMEERWLLSIESPLVLLEKLPFPSCTIAESVAPGSPWLGVMLPSNPLHHLLMLDFGIPLVATSGNLCSEPICLNEQEAMERLEGIADGFLSHDRPVVRPVDDSIVMEVLGRQMVSRRARGFAPIPVPMPPVATVVGPILAVGGHQKNTIAISVGDEAILSQHLGDLETGAANQAFVQTILDFQNLYQARPEIAAVDPHPDYHSTQYAQKSGFKRLIGVQHHVAHALACITENQVSLPALAVVWDGTGLGADDTLWGGEFFVINSGRASRVGHLRTFMLPGGSAAVREPRRAAIGILYEIFGSEVFKQPGLFPVTAFSPRERDVLEAMLDRRLNCPTSSGMGRLFDAVASLLNVRQKTTYEGQAAMELETIIPRGEVSGKYPVPVVSQRGMFVADWQPMVESLLVDHQRDVSPGLISGKFHNGIASLIADMADLVGLNRVALSGGCFQNRHLVEKSVQILLARGHEPFWHQHIPTNDGGISLGQLAAARQSFNLE